MIKFNELFWGDSILEKIIIEYDKIIIKVFNDVLQKEILIECSKCIGITSVYTWDETIIENIILNPIVSEQDPMWKKTHEIYGGESFDAEKDLMKIFYEVKIIMINELELNIICQEMNLREEDTKRVTT